jgi:hypothetical protein
MLAAMLIIMCQILDLSLFQTENKRMTIYNYNNKMDFSFFVHVILVFSISDTKFKIYMFINLCTSSGCLQRPSSVYI